MPVSSRLTLVPRGSTEAQSRIELVAAAAAVVGVAVVVVVVVEPIFLGVPDKVCIFPTEAHL